MYYGTVVSVPPSINCVGKNGKKTFWESFDIWTQGKFGHICRCYWKPALQLIKYVYNEPVAHLICSFHFGVSSGLIKPRHSWCKVHRHMMWSQTALVEYRMKHLWSLCDKSMDWAKTTARREKHLKFGIWCDLYQRFDGMYKDTQKHEFWWDHLKCFENENQICHVIAMLCAAEFTQSQFNSLWPSDAIWWHRTESTLALAMACCLTAPSHYLHQKQLIICMVQLHSYEGNFTSHTSTISL